MILKHYKRKYPNLQEIYGKNSWCILIGANKSVLGMEFVKEIAKQGLHILIIDDRTNDEKWKNDIEERY